jgi:CheY-like chemotaxis protein
MDENERPSRILLIDDDDVNNYIAIKLINKAIPNAAIDIAVNGKVALEKLINLHHNQPDALPTHIFLDINMPIMDAWDFLKEIKLSGIGFLRKVKIFIVSSSLYSNDIERAHSYPFVSDFITKPLSIEKIRKIFNYVY